MKLYLAGSLFTSAERRWNRTLVRLLRKEKFEVFVPQEIKSSPGVFAPKKIFELDRSAIDDCDVVVAWIEGPDPDSGTCWEVGYASGRGKFVIGYTTDLRFFLADYGRHDLNLMLTCGVSKFLRFNCNTSPQQVATKITQTIESWFK